MAGCRGHSSNLGRIVPQRNGSRRHFHGCPAAKNRKQTTGQKANSQKLSQPGWDQIMSTEELPPRESMEFDVVIVGAGPSGLAAAIRLKQLNADVSVVVDRKSTRLNSSHA